MTLYSRLEDGLRCRLGVKPPNETQPHSKLWRWGYVLKSVTITYHTTSYPNFAYLLQFI